MNEATNMRIIRFSQHKSCNLRFTEKTRNNHKRGSFVCLEELYSYSFCFLERKKKHISSLCDFHGEKPKYFSVFQGENSHPERFHLEREKKIKKILFIYF